MKENPYREGSAYHKVFKDLQDAGSNGVTRNELLTKGHKTSDVTVVLSPRAEGTSTRNGDCRGNISAKGHLYYMEKNKRQGEPARFSLEWRSTPLEPKTRAFKKDIESQKESFDMVESDMVESDKVESDKVESTQEMSMKEI